MFGFGKQNKSGLRDFEEKCNQIGENIEGIGRSTEKLDKDLDQIDKDMTEVESRIANFLKQKP